MTGSCVLGVDDFLFVFYSCIYDVFERGRFGSLKLLGFDFEQACIVVIAKNAIGKSFGKRKKKQGSEIASRKNFSDKLKIDLAELRLSHHRMCMHKCIFRNALGHVNMHAPISGMAAKFGANYPAEH